MIKKGLGMQYTILNRCGILFSLGGIDEKIYDLFDDMCIARWVWYIC